MMTDALLVMVSDEDVGLLEYFPLSDEYLFSFDPVYLRNPQRPVLGQFFEDLRPNSFLSKGIPSWFANLLPQDRLRTLLLAGLGINPRSDFELLGAIGQDLPGAVELWPSERRLRTVSPLRLQPGATNVTSAALKFSLAGVQLKLSVIKGEQGLTVPVHGKGGRWIAKFDDPRYPDLPRIELASMTWARESGIDIPFCELSNVTDFEEDLSALDTGNGTVFLIKRFDRIEGASGQRVHMEDFAQILDQAPGDSQYDGSYEQIGAILTKIAPRDLEEFIRRVVFCVVSGNGDAHLKNWSLIYPEKRVPRLSPAYDLVSTILYAPNDNLALSLAGSRKFDKVKLSSFQELADATQLDWSTVKHWVLESAERIRATWANLRSHLELTDRERGILNRHLSRVRLQST